MLAATVQGICAELSNHHCSPKFKYYTVHLPNILISVVFVYAISQLSPVNEVLVYYGCYRRGSDVVKIFFCSSLHCRVPVNVMTILNEAGNNMRISCFSPPFHIGEYEN